MSQLPFQPVESFEDVQADLEFLVASQIAGSATLTWGGTSATSATVTVTHGLPFTPTAITLGSTLTSASMAVVPNLVGAPEQMTFSLVGTTPTGTPAAGATATVYWIATL